MNAPRLWANLLVDGFYVLTIGVYCAVGLVFTLLIGLKWRASLWERSRTAVATSEPQRV